MQRMKGSVFNIQRFSIHDGPGIRTSVFLKGCNLRCLWCHNPESQLPGQEIQFFPQKCQGCGKCAEVCPHGAHAFDAAGKMTYDRSRGLCSGACVERCVNDALVYVSRYLEPEEVLAEVMKDYDYYQNSGGGLTISGGEPLLQKDFVKAVLAGAKASGVHTALDTAAHVRWADLAEVLPVVDLVLLDLKAMDPELHKQGTGVFNEGILANAARLAGEPVDLIVRVPVVPGINASEENMDRTAAFLQGFPRLKYVELLPYHDLGVDKYASLGRAEAPAAFETPSPERMEALADRFRAQAIPVRTE